ncbi:MAG: DsrE family protein [Candidatus Hydrothermarchaeota archaeon]
MKLLLISTKDPISHEHPELVLEIAKIAKEKGAHVKIFLIEDGVLLRKGQEIEEKVKETAEAGISIKAEDISLKTRGVSEDKLVDNIEVSNLDELFDSIIEFDRVVWF